MLDQILAMVGHRLRRRQRDPMVSLGLSNEAAALMMRREFRTALPLARAAAAADPRNGQALNNYGLCLLKSGDPWSAAMQLQGALEAGYTHEGVRYNLGLAYLATGKVEEGLEEWQRVLRANPGNMLVLRDLYQMAQGAGVVAPGQADLDESVVLRLKAALKRCNLIVLVPEDGGEILFTLVRK